MNIESASTPSRSIQGTIINVSFPRSGHRFLREILSAYFENNFVFYESHTKMVIDMPDTEYKISDVNFVKTHDFNLTGRNILLTKFPVNRRYLLQIRHPLESITSYYEFSLKHGHICQDSPTEWHGFLTRNLNYWKRFCDIWILKKQPGFLLVNYDHLYSDTYETTKKAIRYLTKQSKVDSRRLVKVIKDQRFLRYAGDAMSERKNRRHLESFKYFDAIEFKRMEHSLSNKYIQPLGIGLLFNNINSFSE